MKTELVPFIATLIAASLVMTGCEATLSDDLYPTESEPYDGERWWPPGKGVVFPRTISFENETGIVSTFSSEGPTDTSGHPFFEAIGSNGRACVTCHQPADGMSLSTRTIRERWDATNGKDPLFAAIDGSNCPSLPQGVESSHSLLLEYGLIRVFRPWPPKDFDGREITPQFTIEVFHDPTGCNTDPVYGLDSANPMVSVYRRPRPTTNLKYITAVGFPFEPKNGLPLPLDPETGAPVSGNIMADSRARTLKEQAIDAMVTHLQISGEPDREQLAAIIAFESQLYTAQSYDNRAGSLTDQGARGGPLLLAESRGGVLNTASEFPMWDEFESWMNLTEKPAHLSDERFEFRKSVGRGVDFFRNRTFLITDQAGITSMNFGNPVRNDCNFCHNMHRFGNDVAPGQIDLGTTNQPFADPMPYLPLFRLTCDEAYPPHPHMGTVIYTVDPGFALTTGKCVDIGKITTQSMRGLAARPPYFASGFAATIRDIVDYYDRRYNMEMTEQEKEDLTNLMSVL
jgi:hypothetical protein